MKSVFGIPTLRFEPERRNKIYLMITTDNSSVGPNELYSRLVDVHEIRSVFDWIGEEVGKFQCRHICVLVQNDELTDKAIVGGVYGLNLEWFLRLIRTVGFNPIGRCFEKTEDGRKHYFTDTSARRFQGGIYEFAGGLFSRWLSLSLERAFKIRSIYTVALNYEGVRLGSLLYFDRSGSVGSLETNHLETIAAAASRRMHEIRSQKLGLMPKIDFTRTLISQLNHEIRTPLNGILGLTQEVVCSASRGEDNSADLVDELMDCADQLQRTVDNLILNSDLIANRIIFEFQSVSEQQICEYVVGIIASFRGKYPEQSVIFTSCVREPGQWISADLRYLKYVIFELIDNALKFSSLDIQVKLQHSEGFLVMEVEDFGLGIPDVVIDEIFNPFVRTEGQKVHNRGNGVGLSIAKRIMDAHEFDLSLLETSCEGTLFELKMPYILDGAQK